VRRLGHTAEAASDAYSALVKARGLRPEFALLDLNLPGGMDGVELASRLKAEHPAIRLIALTGSALSEDRDKTREAGFEVHLVKPMDPSYLESLLARLGNAGCRARLLQLLAVAPSKPKILTACPQFALADILAGLGGLAHVVHVRSIAEAKRALESDAAIAMILCGVHFERVLELLDYARAAFPAKPFVSCRITDGEAHDPVLKSGTTYIDLPKLADDLGYPQARRRFAQLVMEQLPGAA